MRRVLNPRKRQPFDAPLICEPPHHFVDPPPNWNILVVSAAAFPDAINPRFINILSTPADAGYPGGTTFVIQTDGFPPIFGVTTTNFTTSPAAIPQTQSQSTVRIDLTISGNRRATIYFRPLMHAFP